MSDLAVGSQRRRDPMPLLVALLAAGVVLLGSRLGWRGVDLPAQLFRVSLYAQHGFVTWDSQWYGGHWLLDYSVAWPALASTVGIGAVTVAAGAGAAAAFDRLVTGVLGAGGRAASVTFAIGVAVQAAIGQLPFLAGEATGLTCLVALRRRQWWVALAAGVATPLLSPLDGAFVALAVATTVVDRLVRTRTAPSLRGRVRFWPVAVLAAAGVPVLVTGVAFPGGGAMPYPPTDWLWEVTVAAGFWAAAGRHPVLRTGSALYAVALTASVLVPSPLGGNVGRLEDAVALPLAVALLWDRRVFLGLVAVPLVLSQWTPAWASITGSGSGAWTHQGYYAPLVRFLDGAGGPIGRVEVVPTEAHYEAAYVAPRAALARGWERQLDVGDNPIFYRAGALDVASYRSWLAANGVRWVALPRAPLDGAGVAEGRLLGGGVPGLRPAWSDADWRVWEVVGGTGLAGPGVRVVAVEGGSLVVDVARAVPAVVRVRWTPAWRVTGGSATIHEAPGGWLAIDPSRSGRVSLVVGLPGA